MWRVATSKFVSIKHLQTYERPGGLFLPNFELASVAPAGALGHNHTLCAGLPRAGFHAMRIEPVLVAAQPPPSMPTRRAFLLMASAFAVGAGGGAACGYSLGVRAGEAGGGEQQETGVELQSSGNAELDALRRVAMGPLDELFVRGVMFLFLRITAYPMDPVLWQGVERMVGEIRDNPERVVTEDLLVCLAAQIEGVVRPDSPDLREYVPMLRQRRQALRKDR